MEDEIRDKINCLSDKALSNIPEQKLIDKDRLRKIQEIKKFWQIPKYQKKQGKVIMDFGQWLVTEDGIECIDGEYHIEKERINDNEDWINHMSEKMWVDLNDFVPAYYYAKGFFKDKLENKK